MRTGSPRLCGPAKLRIVYAPSASRHGMRVLLQHRYGNEADLTVEEVAVPEPGPGEVRVRVEACGANASDWEFVTGRPAYARGVAGLLRPKGRTLGSDVAGIVEAVGDRVTALAPGDAVLGDIFGTFGGFAERVVASEKLWVKRVGGMDAVVAATLPQSGTIALVGMGDRVRSGMRVLINGAGGGSGPLALQMAKTAGAEVWAVDNAEKLALLRRLGADRVLDYRAEDFAQVAERFDLVLDLFGTRSARRVRRVLAHGGRYMFVGGPVPVLLNLLTVGPLLGLGSDRKAGVLAVQQGPGRLAELMAMVTDGRLTPVVGEVAPLDDAARALGRMGRGEIAGKLVVVP